MDFNRNNAELISDYCEKVMSMVADMDLKSNLKGTFYKWVVANSCINFSNELEAIFGPKDPDATQSGKIFFDPTFNPAVAQEFANVFIPKLQGSKVHSGFLRVTLEPNRFVDFVFAKNTYETVTSFSNYCTNLCGWYVPSNKAIMTRDTDFLGNVFKVYPFVTNKTTGARTLHRACKEWEGIAEEISEASYLGFDVRPSALNLLFNAKLHPPRDNEIHPGHDDNTDAWDAARYTHTTTPAEAPRPLRWPPTPPAPPERTIRNTGVELNTATLERAAMEIGEFREVNTYNPRWVQVGGGVNRATNTTDRVAVALGTAVTVDEPMGEFR